MLQCVNAVILEIFQFRRSDLQSSHSVGQCGAILMYTIDSVAEDKWPSIDYWC